MAAADARAYVSLSEFRKALKQRFSQWYNRRKGWTGVLWEGRYKSVIVEYETKALRTMATCIDLNPVRAGITEDPAGLLPVERVCGGNGRKVRGAGGKHAGDGSDGGAGAGQRAWRSGPRGDARSADAPSFEGTGALPATAGDRGASAS